MNSQNNKEPTKTHNKECDRQRRTHGEKCSQGQIFRTVITFTASSTGIVCACVCVCGSYFRLYL